MVIEYSNLKALSTEEQITLKSIIEKCYKRVSNFVSDNPKLTVRIKVSNKGDSKRYNISLVLNSKEGIFKTRSKESEAAADYDLTKACHKISEHLTSEVQRGLKSDTANWKKHNVKSLFNEFFK